MARMHPATFPHDLARHPELTAEARVWVALEAALDDRWLVFYNRRIKGCHRPIDFLVAEPTRGLIALEVKGGMVHAFRGAFRQAVHGKGTRPGQRKRIDPFAQTKRALADLFAQSDIDPASLPVHVAAVFPDVSAKAFPWGPSPHLLYAEDLVPGALLQRLAAVLPARPYPGLSVLIACLA